MALKFDLGEALSQAAHAAGEVAKGASATVESAAKGVANAAEGAGNAIVDAAASASEAVGSAMCSAAEGVSNAGEQIASSDAGKAIAGAANAAGGIAVGAAMGLAQGASSLASGAASTVEGGISAIKENSFSARLRKARIKGFRDGIKQGAYLAGQKRHNFIYAYVATLCFLMRCDGDFSQEEREWLEDGLDYLKLDGGLPDDVKAKVQAIADDENLSFDRVKDCLAPRHPRRRARPACGRRREAPVARPQRGARHARRRVRAAVRRARGGTRRESTPIPLTSFTPPLSGCFPWANWPLRTPPG